MTTSALVLHRGAKEISRSDLDAIPVPATTETWFPIGHGQVLDTTIKTLAQAGFQISRTRLAVSSDGAKFFGTLDLTTPLATGVNLAVGIRNSQDKTLPIAFCAGSRVFVCDNLSFRSEVLVARKHTRFGQVRFTEAISQAVQSLHQYREVETSRIRKYQDTEIGPDAADALILRAYEASIIGSTSLPRLIQEWRKPTFEDFEPRNLWSLLNCFTTVLGSRQRSNPQVFAALTIHLYDLLEKRTVTPEPLRIAA